MEEARVTFAYDWRAKVKEHGRDAGYDQVAVKRIHRQHEDDSLD
jgi:hypothetical protein